MSREPPSAGQLLRLSGLALGFALLCAVPAMAEAADAPFWVGVASRILIFALAAVSLDLILGYGGMVSFGHAAFVGVGAYLVAILAHHAEAGTPVIAWPVAVPGTTSALLAWPAAAAGAALCAFLVGLVSLRTAGVYFIMITLAFAQMIYFFFVSLDRYGGDDGIGLNARSAAGPLDLDDPVAFYYLVLGVLTTVLIVCARLVRSRFGMVIQGSRENDRRMQALGFPTYRYRLVCFTLAGAIAGLAGALLANQTEFVSPAFLHWSRSGELLVMVILGGVGTLFGPVLGAAAFLLLEDVLSAYTQHWMILFGPLLILIVLFAKRGLLGLVAGRGTAR
jgi:branched-chain amino acid transport system permease protein